MRKPIIAGNWKMNKTPAQGVALVNELKPLVANADCDVVVCVPATDIYAVGEALKGSNIKLGAENVHWAESGAFTGEISADMLLELGVEYVVKPTNIAEVIFDYRKEENPCSLCAKMRRGALNDLALEMGCQRVALGHHNDDVLETFMLSLLYEGRVNCFSPVTYLDRTDLYSIRPLIYTRECDIKSIAARLNLPVTKSLCPADGNTKREEIKNLIKDIDKTVNSGLKKRLYTAIQTSGIDGWEREKPSRKRKLEY